MPYPGRGFHYGRGRYEELFVGRVTIAAALDVHVRDAALTLGGAGQGGCRLGLAREGGQLLDRAIRPAWTAVDPPDAIRSPGASGQLMLCTCRSLRYSGSAPLN